MRNILMISCQKATKLIELNAHKKPNTTQHIQLFIHTKLCKACNQYKTQSHFINELLHKDGQIENGLNSHDAKLLSPDFKSDLLKRISNIN